MEKMVRTLLAGSIGIRSLPSEMETILDDLTGSNQEILIGDAPGFDELLQSALVFKKYRNVAVYHSLPDVRRNLGQWPAVFVDSGLKSRGHALHSAKDREMCRQADEGIMLWDKSSVGTIANVLDLNGQGKPWALLIFAAGELERSVRSPEELWELQRQNPEPFKKASQRLASSEKREIRQAQQKIGEVQPQLLDFDDE